MKLQEVLVDIRREVYKGWVLIKGFLPQGSEVEVTQKIHLDGEVNRSRCMPQIPSIIAAKASSSEIYVFDTTKQPLDHEGGSCEPYVRLRGHDKEGYGLSWNPFREGYLLSGSNDCKICLWDVSKMPDNKVLDATHVYHDHASVVEDVSWHLMNNSLFGSVDDDCKLMIWALCTNKHERVVVVHDKEVNYLSFNPFNEWVLATSSLDTTVGMFDMRKLTSPLHVLRRHEYVEWVPNHGTVLASSAGDRRLMVWDLSGSLSSNIANLTALSDLYYTLFTSKPACLYNISFICKIIWFWMKSRIARNFLKTGSDQPVGPVGPGTGGLTGPVQYIGPDLHRTGVEPVNRRSNRKTGRLNRVINGLNRISELFFQISAY
ncbi:putative transcription factor WD40-like family [Helianthus anomalus]